jgi:hypothetical protein
MKLQPSLVQGMAVLAMTVITTGTGYADKTVDENGFIGSRQGRRYGRIIPTPTGNSW